MKMLSELLKRWGKTRSNFENKDIPRFAAILKKTDSFLGNRRILRRYVTENALQPAEEVISQKVVDNSVTLVLSEFAVVTIDAIDAEYSVELSNTRAFSDVVIDGEVLIKAAPIQFLLTLEKMLEKKISTIIESIPTLAPGEDWVQAEDQTLPGIHRWPEQKISEKQVKRMDKLVLFEPTEHHPGQAKETSVMVGIGLHIDDSWSGCEHPRVKLAQRARLQKVLKAVLEAQARANASEAVSGHVGENVISYILTGEMNSLEV